MSSKHYQRLPLQDLLLAPASLSAYQRAINNFFQYSRLSLQQLHSASPREIDHLLAEYIQHSFDSSGSFTNAAHALHAVIFHRPDLKQHLFVSRQCIKGWERVKHSTSHPPLTWELTVVIACTLAHSGYHAPSVAMLVAFDCYLRVGELTRLRRCDIVMPHDPRMGQAHTGMAVCLPKTKTGPNQSVSLQSPVVADILYHWVRRLQLPSGSTRRIFDFTESHLRRLMQNACRSLGIGATPYVPHSLRHGGATADFLRTKSIEHVQFRGRWKSMESSRRYIQTARALLAQYHVPPRLNELGIELSNSLLDIMLDMFHTVPPKAPRTRPHGTCNNYFAPTIDFDSVGCSITSCGLEPYPYGLHACYEEDLRYVSLPACPFDVK
jgi:integrase